ncbi:DnaJ domain-containing protein [Tuwongella immobilis]|uniref:J domain-containing protein n=1 Tax=Tuwongella immobilis TaxID=692036 RepID=A0A6C2YPK0_9BACT|nr:DnaJ domain-containing protein [Tuwongella immobilis]VIP02955.1 heat shock protein domain-containing protein : Heat shock protein DnaJ domain protein OS=Isosphaera pallida (strain ATCC 43644 / DSM 9630 / IS1B) GN=Isop_3137 PE=4 SV=1: DnaJ [Tuwongella immobilis]VTS02953.1 heat shock protein domain-containing protein : Heat shock protein DnaJ domain protein OS=Isosphaera pallida (strain ATCC 43644 / DSM 9630 / IS1B) GN=Isop_3137 PE=4 SV=1: DnaJ [Tuwongella immobilis]
MDDPYEVLGLTRQAESEAIRNRYLELVRQNPPEQKPEECARIRQAYDAIADPEDRIRFLLNSDFRSPAFAEFAKALHLALPRPKLTFARFLEAIASQ